MTRGQTQSGDTVLVTGAAGGMGLAAIHVAKALGATVIACASSKEKLAQCRQQGADHIIDYSVADVRNEVRRITSGHMADVVYELVGGDIFKQVISALTI